MGKTARSACIEALKYVQSRHGWVNDEQLAAIAGLLGMSAADLDSVATFYNLIFREPVGQHVIFLCDSVSCWIMGRERVCAKLQQRLGISPGETHGRRPLTRCCRSSASAIATMPRQC